MFLQRKNEGLQASRRRRRPLAGDSAAEKLNAKEYIATNHVQEPPSLRRAGSSSESFQSSSDADADEGFSAFPGHITIERSHFLATFETLLKGLSHEFCDNGLPWEGQLCRSKKAGLSGVLYALPAVTSTGHRYDQVMWPLQAYLSVMADYVFICQDSLWHGIDRCFAVFNLLSIIVRAWAVLNWKVLPLLLIPVGCYMGANFAKQQNDVKSWHFYHCLWHVTGGPLAAMVVYLIHNGPKSLGFL